MSTRFHVSMHEIGPDGATKERADGRSPRELTANPPPMLVIVGC